MFIFKGTINQSVFFRGTITQSVFFGGIFHFMFSIKKSDKLNFNYLLICFLLARKEKNIRNTKIKNQPTMCHLKNQSLEYFLYLLIYAHHPQYLICAHYPQYLIYAHYPQYLIYAHYQYLIYALLIKF